MGDLETPCISLPAGQFHIPKGFVSLKKGLCKRKVLFLVEEGGFEPPKLEAADLQSVPFGHSGTPPYTELRKRKLILQKRETRLLQDEHTARLRQSLL